MYRVALNVCMFQLKKRKKQAKVKEQWPNNAPVFDPDGDEVMMERSSKLSDAIKKLKEIDRALILLYLEDQSYKEISEILGISVSNVGVKINRIKAQLKDMLHGTR